MKEHFFPRGYLITPKDTELINGKTRDILARWKKDTFGNNNVYLHPDTEFLKIDNKVMLIGHVYNPWRNEANENDILANLYNLKDDHYACFEYLNELSGRFVIIKNINNNLRVYGDCSSTRLITYSFFNRSLYLSSHPKIIADILEGKKDINIENMLSRPFYNIGIRHLPGIKTEYENIYILIANTYLQEFEKQIQVNRLFPLQPFKKIELEYSEIINKVAYILQESMEILSERYNLIVSLTGGVDSRMTMAASKKNWEDILFYTFYESPKEAADVKAVKDLTEEYKINHHLEKIEDHKEEKNFNTFLKTHRKNIGNVRNDGEANKIYHINFKYWPKNTLEIKSSVSEISRCFYEKKLGIKNMPKNLSVRNMSNLYKRNMFNRKELKFMDDSFNEFKEITNFGREFGDLRETDMFYWEHRISAWQSLVLQDSDYSHDSSIIFNNRKLMIYMLSIDKEKLFSDRAQIDIINLLHSGLGESIISNTGYNNLKGFIRTNLEKIFFKINNF